MQENGNQVRAPSLPPSLPPSVVPAGTKNQGPLPPPAPGVSLWKDSGCEVALVIVCQNLLLVVGRLS